jgi:hypothetical protein
MWKAAEVELYVVLFPLEQLEIPLELNGAPLPGFMEQTSPTPKPTARSIDNK